MVGQQKNIKLLVVVGKNVKEIKQMASVVGKTIFSDGKGKLFFGYYKTDDAVEFVDYKTWKKLSFKDVSKGDTNKQRVIKAIVKNQKQFNKKVDFNMWAKQKKRTFEETMDWFIQNGWISNVTKRGIKESVDVLSVNEDKGEVEKIAKRVGKNEIKFYDALSKVEKRLGSKYPKFLDTALKQLKQNPAKFKTNADKEEAIFQSVK